MDVDSTTLIDSEEGAKTTQTALNAAETATPTDIKLVTAPVLPLARSVEAVTKRAISRLRVEAQDRTVPAKDQDHHQTPTSTAGKQLRRKSKFLHQIQEHKSKALLNQQASQTSKDNSQNYFPNPSTSKFYILPLYPLHFNFQYNCVSTFQSSN